MAARLRRATPVGMSGEWVVPWAGLDGLAVRDGFPNQVAPGAGAVWKLAA